LLPIHAGRPAKAGGWPGRSRWGASQAGRGVPDWAAGSRDPPPCLLRSRSGFWAPFEGLVGGRPAEVTGPKRHALLALLALRGGRLVPVEVLVDALWGAQVPVAPRNADQPDDLKAKALAALHRLQRLRT
jgi:hypothetical protein